MRHTGFGGFSFGIDLTPVVRKLLVANFAVWFVQLFFGFAASGAFEDLFALDPARALPWRPWQILTYMFLHSAPRYGAGFNPLHILLNMLMLVMFGGAVERRLGGHGFLRFYLLCGVAGGVLTLLPPFRAVTVGASGAVLGVLTAFGLLYPDVPVLLFFFPVPAKLLVIFLALLNLFSAAGAGGNIAYIAHVGGMGMAYVLLRGLPFRARLRRFGPWRRRSGGGDRRRETTRASLDAILEKMHREGRDGLTQEEWRALVEESKRLRDRE